MVRETIVTGRAIKINNIVKTYQFDLVNRLNNYLQLSKKINDEILHRDLKEVNTDTLLKMSIANDGRIKDLVNKNIQIGENEFIVKMESDGFFTMQLDE